MIRKKTTTPVGSEHEMAASLFKQSLGARLSYEDGVAEAVKQCEQDVERARARLQRDKLELQRRYEDEMQHASHARAR
jgi:hypothetical protein